MSAEESENTETQPTTEPSPTAESSGGRSSPTEPSADRSSAADSSAEPSRTEPTGPTDPAISARNLSVSFRDVSVITDVDIEVERGSLVGLVGPNGAGKTTILRAIKGAITPDTGTVRLNGTATANLSARQIGRRVASVPQETGLAFDFKVRHVVEMGRTPHLGRFDTRGAEDAQAVTEAMEDAEVSQFADRSITEVSGGERQRVLLARALAQETPALVLDEPTASLDVNHAVRTLELVSTLVDDGRAVLAAIHDLEIAARYCDKIVILANGGVHAVGPPEDVLTAEALRAAFDAEAFVGRGVATGKPTVTTFDAAGDDTAVSDDGSTPHVHLVGSGRDSARIAARLAATQLTLSAGVVPEGDALAGVVADAGGTVISAPPFRSPDDVVRDAAAALARRASVSVIITAGSSPYAAEGSSVSEIDTAAMTQPPAGVSAVNAATVGAAETVLRVDPAVSDQELLRAVREAAAVSSL